MVNIGNRKKVFLFVGQGLVCEGIPEGIPLLEADYNNIVQYAEDIMKIRLRDLSCQDLTKQRVIQPLLFAVGLSCYYYLISEGIQPGLMVGHSLGEYIALVAAGALSLEDGLRIIRACVEVVEESSSMKVDGEMLSVFGVQKKIVQSLVNEINNSNCHHFLQIAIFQLDGQLVVSGYRHSLDAFVRSLQRKNIDSYRYMNIGYPFHSSLASPVADAVDKVLQTVEVREPKTPIMGTHTLDLMRDSSSIRKNMIGQLTNPIYWEKVIRLIRLEGYTHFIELGFDRILLASIARVDRSTVRYSVKDIVAMAQNRVH